MKFYTNATVIGNNVCAKEVINGKRVKSRIPFSPTLYTPSQDKNAKFRTLEGTPVDPVQPGSIDETREFVKTYDGVQGFSLYGNTNYNYSWISEEYPQEEVEYELKHIRAFSMDIETESEYGFPEPELAREKINAITFYNMANKEFHVFGLEIYGKKYIPDTTRKITYHAYQSEEELLTDFISHWQSEDPDIVTGWNVEFFDIPYIINRIVNLMGESAAKKLSSWGKIRARTVNFYQQEKPTYEIYGVAILDLYRLYRKYVLEPRDYYKLDYIASVELGKQKIQHDEYENFKDFYQQDYPKYIAYNIEDTVLIDELETKLKLIELTMTVAYQAHVNYEDVISQVRSWDTLIYNWLLRKHIVIPQKVHMSKGEQYAGAYVHDPRPSRYWWVISYDVTSLYPSIIRALNIGIETKKKVKNIGAKVRDMLTVSEDFKDHFETAKEHNCTYSTNGIFYSKDHKSFYSEMITKLFDDRVEYRKQAKVCKDNGDKLGEAKFDLKQKSTKIQMNSLYGAMGSQYFRFFDIENAEAVTFTGQFIIQHIERGINTFFNNLLQTQNVEYVVYCDTDSIYICLEKLVKKIIPTETDPRKITDFLIKCEPQIERELDRLFTDIEDNYINGVKGYLKMKREVIADQGIWTSKKRYALNCYDVEGERFGTGDPNDKKHMDPKFKATGLEIKKATVPKFCREKMEQGVKILLATNDNDKVIELIEETKKAFKAMTPAQIAAPKTCNNLAQYEKETKGVPLHVKGALCYNRLIREKGLDKKYPAIQEGEKVKILYLKVPNPTLDKQIAFPQTLPVELGLDKFVDYDLQFEKNFLDPLSSILDAVGFVSKKQSSLKEWF